MTDPPDTDASTKPLGGGVERRGDDASWVDGTTIEWWIRRLQADRALNQVLDELLPDTIADLVESECGYPRGFAALYWPGLAAMGEGDFVSAAPGPDFGPED